MIDDALDKYWWWKYREDKQRRGTVLVGEHRVTDTRGGTNRFKVEIFVPRDFPEPGVHPKAKILEHDLGVYLTPEAHVGSDGTMCVQFEARNEINYARDGLVRFFEQVEVHLYRARMWSILSEPHGQPSREGSGHYPGPEYAHYDAGRREYQTELGRLREPFEALRAGLPQGLGVLVDPSVQLPSARRLCPCGSSAAFGVCHRPLVKARREEWRRLGRRPELPANPRRRTGAMLRELHKFLSGRSR